MQHCGTRTLFTAHLILRPFSPQDGEAMFRNWASDPEVTRYLTWPPHENPEQTAQLCHIWSAAALSPNKYIWALEHRECHEVIGSLSAVDLNEQTGVMELGYCLSRAFQGRGLMTEALRAVLRCLFENTSVRVIRAAHDTQNPASGRVMDKAGMMREGIARGTGLNNQGICDVLWHSLTRAEYEEQHSGRVHFPETAEERAMVSAVPRIFPDSSAYSEDMDQVMLAVLGESGPESYLCLHPLSADVLEITAFGADSRADLQEHVRLLVGSARAYGTRMGFRCLQLDLTGSEQDISGLDFSACGFPVLDLPPCHTSGRRLIFPF